MTNNPIQFTDGLTAPPEPRRTPTLRIQILGSPDSGLIYAIREASNFPDEVQQVVSPLVDKFTVWDGLIPMFAAIRYLPSLAVVFFDDRPKLSIQFEVDIDAEVQSQSESQSTQE